MTYSKPGFFLLLLLLVGLQLSGCSNIQKTDESSFSQLTSQQKADVYESTIAAGLAENKQDYATALSYYLYAARISNDPKLIKKSTELAQRTKDPLGLEQSASLWLNKNPENQQAQLLMLEAQIALANLEKALPVAKNIFNSSITLEEQYNLLKASVINKNPKVVVPLLQQLSKDDPKNLAFITAEAEIFYNYAARDASPNELYSKVLVYTQKALNINPLFLPAVDLKVSLLYSIKQHNEAKRYLSDLFAKNPQSADINQMLGQLLYDLKDYEQSAIHYDNWLQKNPKDLESKYFLAASHYALAQYELSLNAFKELFAKNYQADITAYYCGESAKQLKQAEQAIECFKQVKSGKLVAAARLQIANIFLDLQQPEQSLAILRISSDLNPQDQTKLLIAEIDLLNKAFSTEKSKERLEQAIQDQPDNVSLLLKKIDLYQLTKQPEKLYQLLKDAQALIKSQEKIDRFNLLAAELLQKNKHHELAIDWLDSAIKDSPKNKQLLYSRALYKESLGLYQEMVSELKALNQLFPDDANIKNALGYSLADLNQELDFSQALIDSAYQALPNSSAVIDSKGWIAYRLGNLDAAQEYLTRALTIQPSAETAAHLGEVLWKKSLHEKAKKIWREGIKIDPTNKILLDTLKRLNVEL